MVSHQFLEVGPSHQAYWAASSRAENNSEYVAHNGRGVFSLLSHVVVRMTCNRVSPYCVCILAVILGKINGPSHLKESKVK